MPKGTIKTKEEWDAQAKVFSEIDVLLEGYAEDNDLWLTKNDHHWPSRNLRWGNGINKMIQIYLEDVLAPTYNFLVTAYRNINLQRFIKNEFLKKEAPFAEIKNDLISLLDLAKKKADAWEANDLKPVK